jgi:hypothetical protein
MLVKLPVPVLFVVLLSAIVGVWFVPQQTPRAFTAAQPSLVIFPPQVAVVWVIYITAVVVNTGLPSFLQPFRKSRNIPIKMKEKIRRFLFFFTLKFKLSLIVYSLMQLMLYNKLSGISIFPIRDHNNIYTVL